MRPIWLQLLVLTTAMVVSPLSLSALTDSWGFELPEEPQAQASQAAEPLPEEAEEASEWGGWGLKTASGDFFEEEPDYTGKGWPQTQQPRRENGDFAYDTASDVRNGPNVYTYVTQNPWTFFDPLGLAERMPEGKIAARRQMQARWKASGGYLGKAKRAAVFVKDSVVENFTDPGSLIMGGFKGEFEGVNAQAVGVGVLALGAAVVETGLDIVSGGAGKAPKKLAREGAEALGEAAVERLGREAAETTIESSAKETAKSTRKVVIGEDMDRVDKRAEQLGAET